MSVFSVEYIFCTIELEVRHSFSIVWDLDFLQVREREIDFYRLHVKMVKIKFRFRFASLIQK